MGVYGITSYLKNHNILPSDENDSAVAPGENNSHNNNTTITAGPHCGCSVHLWKEWNPSMAFSSSLNRQPGYSDSNDGTTHHNNRNNPYWKEIPSQSKLLIDGNGLAFHLFHVAYARYMKSWTNTSTTTTTTTTFKTTSTNSTQCCPKLKALSGDTQWTQCLPMMMPLSWLREVTIEFATTLIEDHDMILKCYWDGPSLPIDATVSTHHSTFKEQTRAERQQRIHDKWVNLQTFCDHGTLPVHAASEYACSCIWHFPVPYFFQQTVQHALRSVNCHGSNNNKVEMIICEAGMEADMVLANDAKGDDDSYVVGQDSDFLFYADIQYIPFAALYRTPNDVQSHSAATISTSYTADPSPLHRREQQRQLRQHPSPLYAVCLTRKGLAKYLQIDDLDMPELAILLGNDYVVDPLKTLILPKHLKQKKKNKNFVEEAINYLRDYHDTNINDDDNDDDDDDVNESDNEDKFKDARMDLETHTSAELNDDEGDCRIYLKCKPKKINGTDGSSPTTATTPAMEYVRQMYRNIGNLDWLKDHGENVDEHSNDEEQEAVDASFEFDLDNQDIISFPDDFPLHLLKVPIKLRDTLPYQKVIAEALQVYIDQHEGNKASDGVNGNVLSQLHVDAYHEFAHGKESLSSMMMKMMKIQSFENIKLVERPTWQDIYATFLIEICVSKILKHTLASTSSSATMLLPPAPEALMDLGKFLTTLANIRSKNQGTEASDKANQSIVEQNANDDVKKEDDSDSVPPVEIVERPVLPIDEHQDNILSTIYENRVTIIHGETGCGKSSRVPVMILEAESPEPSLPTVKMFISQPRRIAAASLVKRVRSCEPKHTEKFALRMGHGHREFETKKTQAWFVTTGYLTRLLANHPERFNDITHLVIDEVHERSVDTDILCLLCKRLLQTNEKIRIVLMSATLATKLYQDYFEVPTDPIHVGVRRFPIKEFFVEDLLSEFKLPPSEVTAVTSIVKECDTKRCKTAPSAAEIQKRFALAARLTTLVGKPGASVLIFVPGMGEIISITEAIEKLYRPGISYICYPIHSDVPFEDQMGAFDAPGEDEVKVIIATNAAESSVTLPAVDHVICLGLCRQIIYNQKSHRQMLTPCWISRASATQRAGRTGRVRPGNVYRLYTRNAFDKCMDEFEQGEMVRIPLDSVILMLKEMLHEEAKPVLLSCIEAPPMETIEKSFASLHHWRFLTEPSDTGEITRLGSFVSALGVDLTLGSFIGLGIQFGVAAEAIEMAAVMSFPKSPFQISNPLFHSPSKYNEITSACYVAKAHFDAALYSEPFALMNALWDYEIACQGQERDRWCTYYRFAHARMRQLHSTRNSLRKRVADFFGINEEKVQTETPPVHMPHYKVALLRILKVWVFPDNIISSKPAKLETSADGSCIITVPKERSKKHGTISEEHLDQVLIPSRHRYRIRNKQLIESKGYFETGSPPFSLLESISKVESRLVSYMCETDIEIACLRGEGHVFIYVRDNDDSLLANNLAKSFRGCEHRLLMAYQEPNMKRRGVLERKCGLWTVQTSKKEAMASKSLDTKLVYHSFSFEEDGSDIEMEIKEASHGIEEMSFMEILFTEATGKKKKAKKKESQSSGQGFVYILEGSCSEITMTDMKDILGAQVLEFTHTKSSNQKSLVFPGDACKPLAFKGKTSKMMATNLKSAISSWNRPLFTNIPEGGRLLSVLASSRRKGQAGLRFPSKEENADDDDFVEFLLIDDEVQLGKRWRRMGSDINVYVDTDTIPISATSSKFPLYACCSNMLEIRGGAVKVEGISLLPPNPLFLLLCRLTFGLEPNVCMDFGSMAQLKSNTETGKKIQIAKANNWLKNQMKDIEIENDEQHQFDFITDDSDCPAFQGSKVKDAKEKIKMALDFNESCATLGEELVCFPEQVKALCNLFDGVEAYDMEIPTSSFEEKAFTHYNLETWCKEAKRTLKVASLRKVNQINVKTTETIEKAEKNEEEVTAVVSVTPKQDKKKKIPVKWRILNNFDDATIAKSVELFSTTLDGGKELSQSTFPSTNILSLLIKEYHTQVAAMSSKKHQNSNSSELRLDSGHWEITIHEQNDRQFYHAKYLNPVLPITNIVGRGKNNLQKWIKSKKMRPMRKKDIKLCVPPTVTQPRITVFQISNNPVFAYDTIEDALCMEAAFFLERQFGTATKNSTQHWFDQSLETMLRYLLQTQLPNGTKKKQSK